MQLAIEVFEVNLAESCRKAILDELNNLCKTGKDIVKVIVAVRKNKGQHQPAIRMETRLIRKSGIIYASGQADSIEPALKQVVSDLSRQLRIYKVERKEIW